MSRIYSKTTNQILIKEYALALVPQTGLKNTEMVFKTMRFTIRPPEKALWSKYITL